MFLHPLKNSSLSGSLLGQSWLLFQRIEYKNGKGEETVLDHITIISFVFLHISEWLLDLNHNLNLLVLKKLILIEIDVPVVVCVMDSLFFIWEVKCKALVNNWKNVKVSLQWKKCLFLLVWVCFLLGDEVSRNYFFIQSSNC